jgi:hypothetical protein
MRISGFILSTAGCAVLSLLALLPRPVAGQTVLVPAGSDWNVACRCAEPL